MQPSRPAADPVLSRAEAARRADRLAALSGALAEHGTGSVLARHHRLVLRASNLAGLYHAGNPELYVFGRSGTTVVTTDGAAYRAGGEAYPADPAAAAALIAPAG